MESNGVLTEQEAAKYLLSNPKPDTLRKWRHRGRGPAYIKLCGKIRYKLADLENFVAAGRVVPGEKPKRRGRRTA